MSLLPSPRATDGTKGGPNQRGSSGDLMLPSAVHGLNLLPTPSVADGMGGHLNRSGDRSGELLLPGVAKLLPTPVATDAADTRHSTANRSDPDSGHHGGTTMADAIDEVLLTVGDFRVGKPQDWGVYADAVFRWWELTRMPPSPTMVGRTGNKQLSPAFSEWMMGLPAGWVTDTPGITRNEALRVLGNGVVPRQAAAALLEMLTWSIAA